MLKQELDRAWSRIEEAHERSLIGNLVRPDDLYFPPEQWWSTLSTLPGADLEHLGITRLEQAETAVPFPSQPAPRFHGSVPAMVEEVQKLISAGKQRRLRRAQHRRSGAPGRYFHRIQRPVPPGQPHPSAAKAMPTKPPTSPGDVLTTTLVKAYVPDGVVFPDAHLAIFGARDLFDESELVASRPQRQKSKVSAFLSDFRDLQVGDYVVHVEHGIAQYQGLKEIKQGDGTSRIHGAGVRGGGASFTFRSRGLT